MLFWYHIDVSQFPKGFQNAAMFMIPYRKTEYKELSCRKKCVYGSP